MTRNNCFNLVCSRQSNHKMCTFLTVAICHSIMCRMNQCVSQCVILCFEQELFYSIIAYQITAHHDGISALFVSRLLISNENIKLMLLLGTKRSFNLIRSTSLTTMMMILKCNLFELRSQLVIVTDKHHTHTHTHRYIFIY